MSSVPAAVQELHGSFLQPPFAESNRPLPTDAANGQGDGYQWWTIPNTDAFAALRLAGQSVYVQPSPKTMIVKLSFFAPSADCSVGRGLKREAAAIFAAPSARQPQ